MGRTAAARRRYDLITAKVKSGRLQGWQLALARGWTKLVMMVVTEKRQRTWRIAARKLRDDDSLSRQSRVQLVGLQCAADADFALPFLSFSSSKFQIPSVWLTYRLISSLSISQGDLQLTGVSGRWVTFPDPFVSSFLLFRAAIKEGYPTGWEQDGFSPERDPSDCSLDPLAAKKVVLGERVSVSAFAIAFFLPRSNHRCSTVAYPGLAPAFFRS